MAEWAVGGRAWSSSDGESASSSASEACTISTDFTAVEGHGQDAVAASIAEEGFQQRWSPRQAAGPWNESAPDVPSYAGVSGDDQELFYYGVEHRNPAAASHEFVTRQAAPAMIADSATASAAMHQPFIAPLLATGQDVLVDLDGTGRQDMRAISAVPAGQTLPVANQPGVQAAATAWPLAGITEGVDRNFPSQVKQDAQANQDADLRSQHHPPPTGQLVTSQPETATSEVANACPFCTDEPPFGKTRQRRVLKRERQRPKFGRWWRQAGYSGPKYCQRCSEVFRDHIMRQKPNSASCTRSNPCDDCGKVLRHFDKSGQVLWDAFDERAATNKAKVVEKRRQHQADASTTQPSAQRAKSNPATAVGAVDIA